MAVVDEPAGWQFELMPYLRGATEMLAVGLFTSRVHDSVRAAIAELVQE